MKINLKDFSKEIKGLEYIEKILLQDSLTKPLAKKIRKVIRFHEEIETDVEMCGESIVELDKERLAAIEERNKALAFNKEEDI
jgi:hypothetical protein